MKNDQTEKPKEKLPWFKFWGRDWRTDTGLRSVSAEARGVWVDLLCIMNDCEPRGFLKVNGSPIAVDKLAKMCGVDLRKLRRILKELKEANVYSVDESGAIYSRRMVEDERIHVTSSANGSTGGNPVLVSGGKAEANDPKNENGGLAKNGLSPESESETESENRECVSYPGATSPGLSAVGTSTGFPKDLDEAIALVAETGASREVVEEEYNWASGRGGRDSKGNLIWNWTRYFQGALKARQKREAKENERHTHTGASFGKGERSSQRGLAIPPKDQPPDGKDLVLLRAWRDKHYPFKKAPGETEKEWTARSLNP